MRLFVHCHRQTIDNVMGKKIAMRLVALVARPSVGRYGRSVAPPWGPRYHKLHCSLVAANNHYIVLIASTTILLFVILLLFSVYYDSLSCGEAFRSLEVIPSRVCEEHTPHFVRHLSTWHTGQPPVGQLRSTTMRGAVSYDTYG